MKKENRLNFDNILVSFYSDINKPASKEVISLTRWFKPHVMLDQTVLSLRKISDKKERDAVKVTLPSITPSGTFKYRENNKLIKYSGFISIDIDHLEDSVYDVKEYVSRLPFVAYCGLSASALGIWALVRVFDNPGMHTARFDALVQDFKDIGLTIDTTGRNISRARFYSVDNDPYFNLDAEFYTRAANIGEGTAEPLQVEPYRGLIKEVERPEFKEETYFTLNYIELSIEHANDGEKHKKLLKTSIAAGFHVASGTITEREAIYTLQQAIKRKKNVSDLGLAYKTIMDGLQIGKAKFKKQHEVPEPASLPASYSGAIAAN
jgi:hypothetical protein